jgi:hypothetical protein
VIGDAFLTGGKADWKSMDLVVSMRSIRYPPPRLTISTSGRSRATTSVSRAAFYQIRQSLPDPTCECRRKMVRE